MISKGVYVIKEKKINIRKTYALIYFCIVLLVVNSCSKSDKKVIIDKSDPDMIKINENLRDYMFLREDFNEPERYGDYLEKLILPYYKSCSYVGSSHRLWLMEGRDISHWLKGRVEDEDVLKQLCSDPKFIFGSNKWKVEFNVLKQDGSVDRCKIAGKYYPQKQYNQIEKMEIRSLKPKGTFSFYP